MEPVTSCVVDTADGYYQVGFPEPVECFDKPIIATATGVLVPVGPETEIVQLAVARAAAAEQGTLAGYSVDVAVSEEWEVMDGTAEPASPAVGAIVGPGRWRLSLQVVGSPSAIRRGGEDMVEEVVESHVLVIFPLDSAADEWRPAAPIASTRGSLSEVWFLDAKPGQWTLGSRSAPVNFSVHLETPRLRSDSELLSITVGKRSEITVFSLGQDWPPVPSEQWRLHAEATLPAGAVVELRRPDGRPARGLPTGPELVGPARIRVFLRDPEDEFDEVLSEDGGSPVIVYTRDTSLSDDIKIEVLLD